jgi:hypothetical protein
MLKPREADIGSESVFLQQKRRKIDNCATRFVIADCAENCNL